MTGRATFAMATPLSQRILRAMATRKATRTEKSLAMCFRGQDTHYSFTGNLYKALYDKRIHHFFDDDKLQSGEEI
ncbi:TMV resistance protein N-like [Arachis hypogaea]|nr:TMV resistance protein N-like [Arachis hypogaea]